MSYYRITSTQGVVLGTYAGATPEAAVAAMDADAGHDGPADPTLLVERVMPEVDQGDYLVEQSIEHDRIEHADHTEGLAYYLSMASEDSAETRTAEGDAVYEYWGTTPDGDEWRVHLLRAIVEETAEIEVTIQERGNGFPLAGDYVSGDSELYRVVRLSGRIHTDGTAGNYANATVEHAEWDACPESEVHTAHVVLRSTDAWWAWHDGSSDRWSASTEEAEVRCAEWVAGRSDDGPVEA